MKYQFGRMSSDSSEEFSERDDLEKNDDTSPCVAEKLSDEPVSFLIDLADIYNLDET
jgi:hypothetical protein